jgi:hypothetical protein
VLANVQPSYDPKLVEKLEEAQLPWSVVLVITREEYLLVDDFHSFSASGALKQDEFCKLMRRHGVPKEQAKLVFTAFDRNANGCINLDELLDVRETVLFSMGLWKKNMGKSLSGGRCRDSSSSGSISRKSLSLSTARSMLNRATSTSVSKSNLTSGWPMRSEGTIATRGSSSQSPPLSTGSVQSLERSAEPSRASTSEPESRSTFAPALKVHALADCVPA